MNIETTQDLRDVADTHRSLERTANRDLGKIIEDDRFAEMVFGSELNDMMSFISPQNGLTYFSNPELIYAQQSLIHGIVQIRSCYVDERNPRSFFLLQGIEHMSGLQLRNSQKGFKETLILENGLRVTGEKREDKRDILGRPRN